MYRFSGVLFFLHLFDFCLSKTQKFSFRIAYRSVFPPIGIVGENCHPFEQHKRLNMPLDQPPADGTAHIGVLRYL